MNPAVQTLDKAYAREPEYLKLAYSAGTKHPHIAMTVNKPICFRYVLLPIELTFRLRVILKVLFHEPDMLHIPHPRRQWRPMHLERENITWVLELSGMWTSRRRTHHLVRSCQLIALLPARDGAQL